MTHILCFWNSPFFCNCKLHIGSKRKNTFHLTIWAGLCRTGKRKKPKKLYICRESVFCKILKLIIVKIAKCLIIIFLACAISSCGKEKTDYKKLEGSAWEAVTDDAVFLLLFLDEHVCYMNIIGKNMTITKSYSWRYGGEFDSRWGYFHMFPQNGEHPYSGSVENKKLYLHIYENDIDILCFVKIEIEWHYIVKY